MVTKGGDLAVNRIKPAYQQVADQVRELVLGGQLVPGDRLPVEAELAGAFGVSRSTVREALRVLSSQGLIHTLRGTTGGSFVVEVDAASIADLLELKIGLLSGTDAVTADELLEARELLELPAAALAATRRTEEHLSAMRAAIEAERRESERERQFVQHHLFHSVLLDAAGNRLIHLMTVPIFRVIRSRFLNDQNRAFWSHVDHDHEELLERIEQGDATGATEAMRAHLGRLRSSYTQPELRAPAEAALKDVASKT